MILFSLAKLFFPNDFSISIRSTSKLSSVSWILANIYDPCQAEFREIFLDWFKNIQMPDDSNWLIMVFFNYIRYPSNRNRDGGIFSDMMKFNDAISTPGLVEISLDGRSLSWIHMQGAPLLEKLDCISSSESWRVNFPYTLVLPYPSPTLNMYHVSFKLALTFPNQRILVLKFSGSKLITLKSLFKVYGNKMCGNKIVLRESQQNSRN